MAAAAVLTTMQRQLDRVFPPKSRQEAYAQALELATTRPFLFSFILAEAAITLTPMLLFLTFTLSTLVFALGCVALFTLLWTGLALLVLIPTLFVASGIALCVWAWGAATFFACRWTLGALQDMSAPAPAGAAAPVEDDPGRHLSASSSPASWAKVEKVEERDVEQRE
ncbi:hypothetical protein C8A03DRAFT_38499 [Achaetomium macrosporum]|uniref:Uncharacterized protein n=1 Tax=Achaetomium macrosporum TaxID=79813 RepID=A0AAN7C1T1_9PEZI|nr:hypothetical protein C8A03DRAFT_38499 [Achaetomium macrosporum]